MGDYAENIMEYAQRLRKEELSLSPDAVTELKNMVDLVNQLYDVSINAFEKREICKLIDVGDIEQKIDEVCKDLENRHIQRVKEGLCSAPVGSIYLQTISNLERVGDHLTNVAFSMSNYKNLDKQECLKN